MFPLCAINFTDTSQGATSWNWDFGDGQTFSGETPASHTYLNPNVQDTDYTIQLAIADQNGCVDTARHQVIVYGTPTVDAPDDQFICNGDSVQLEVTANVSGGTPTFIWYPAAGLSDSTVYNPFAFPDTKTLYHVMVYSQNNCSNQDSVVVAVQEAPTVTYSPDTTIHVGDMADLFIQANQPNVSFTWTPSYGLSCTNCTDVYAQPLETTIYHITYEDSAGCFSKSVPITVFVDERYTIDVPTAFTPNGDGKNDVVYVKGWGIKNLLEFSIYNRWGERVFTTDGPTVTPLISICPEGK
jgi:PKD repeat protein